MEKILVGVAAVFFVLVISAVLSLLTAWPFMWLWNSAVVKAVTVTEPIGYWVAYKLIFFLGLFFAGSKSSKS